MYIQSSYTMYIYMYIIHFTIHFTTYNKILKKGPAQIQLQFPLIYKYKCRPVHFKACIPSLPLIVFRSRSFSLWAMSSAVSFRLLSRCNPSTSFCICCESQTEAYCLFPEQDVKHIYLTES